MSLTTVELQPIDKLLDANVHCYLIHDSAITDLEYPDHVTIMDIGDIVESVDTNALFTEFDNVNVEVMEDYDNHTEGFWHKLINGYPEYGDFEMMFTKDEGTDETFLFRGKLYRRNADEPEHYMNTTTGIPTDVVRSMKFKLVSSLLQLQDVDIDSLCTEVLTHLVSKDVPECSYPTGAMATFRAIIASMIKLAWGEAYDSSVVVDNSDDVQLKGDGDEYGSFLNFYIIQELFMDAYGSPISIPQTYKTTFLDAYELFKHLCQMFAIIPRYTYGTAAGLIDATPANNKHRITFNARGRSSAGAVTMVGKVEESLFLPDTNRRLNSLKAVSSIVSANLAWYFKDGIIYQAVPKDWMKIDKQIEFDFETSWLNSTPVNPLYIFYLHSGNDKFYTVKHTRYWDYVAGAYVVCDDDYTGATGYYNNYAKAVINYLFKRFALGRTGYERTYGDMKAQADTTISQRCIKTLADTAIHDGVESRNYYATQVTKKIKENKVKVVWVEE